ncbi:MFS transporter [Streptomyces sp. 11x1]|uniref:MFS transporter n=1 Tax=Streptomyces sp. 11x1 TaxID=3038642 RepID=UPI002931F4E1|nr:MFS transporter [Streptomyces sp. 11x1]WNZ08506.1 MFS transporter [Streptomyces sp. 11x1]
MTRPQAGRRDFTLLWTSQAAAELAYSTSLIALPLLVLTVTGSPTQAGVISFVDAAATLLAGLPAGAVADRFERRSVLLWCEGILTVIFGVASLSLWLGTASMTLLVVLALLNGAATAVLFAAGTAMVPTLVPPDGLTRAVSMNSARTYAGQLIGTSAGGALQAAKNALPFVAGCAAHAVGFVLLLFLRPGPPADRTERSQGRQGHDLLDGIRWIRAHRFLAHGLFYATVTNFFYGAVYFVVIASAKTSGMNSGLVGAMAALLGVGGLLGALAVPLLQRILTGARPVYAVLWLFTLVTAGIAVLPGGYTPGVLLGICAFTAPTASAYFTTYQLRLTPDSHRGRVMSVANVCGGGAGAVAPLAGGTLYDLCGRAPTLLGCAAALAAVALSALFSKTLRAAPQLSDVAS